MVRLPEKQSWLRLGSWELVWPHEVLRTQSAAAFLVLARGHCLAVIQPYSLDRRRSHLCDVCEYHLVQLGEIGLGIAIELNPSNLPPVQCGQQGRQPAGDRIGVA